MTTDDDLAALFAAERDHLRAVAHRLLGSVAEADDALQDTWLRAQRADRTAIANPAAWLTTVTSRLCLDRLRARARRTETMLAEVGVVGVGSGPDPQDEAVVVESVGRALLVVLDRLTPAQRVAFVLHDLFAVPFEEVAEVVDRSVEATKKLASRARDRVRGGPGDVEVDLAARAEHQAVVAAFLAAARGGDVDALLGLLAPEVVRRADRRAVPSGAAAVVRGAPAVAEETRVLSSRSQLAAVVLVDGVPGLVVAPGGRLELVLRIVVVERRITRIDVVGDPDRLAALDLAVLDG